MYKPILYAHTDRPLQNKYNYKYIKKITIRFNYKGNEKKILKLINNFKYIIKLNLLFTDKKVKLHNKTIRTAIFYCVSNAIKIPQNLSNLIVRKGNTVISHIRKLKHLNSLKLSENKITRLKLKNYNTRLETLNLDWCKSSKTLILPKSIKFMRIHGADFRQKIIYNHGLLFLFYNCWENSCYDQLPKSLLYLYYNKKKQSLQIPKRLVPCGPKEYARSTNSFILPTNKQKKPSLLINGILRQDILKYNKYFALFQNIIRTECF